MPASKTEQKQVVMRDSPEAASYRTDIKGWVSRDGFFYGDGDTNEATARYAGCTHVACNRCGAPVEKRWLACDGCRDLMDLECFEKMPKADWDGESMLYSKARDTYYNGLEDALDALEEGQALADLLLVICTPNRGSLLTDEYFADEFPEYGDSSSLPDEVWAAMEAFNAAVQAMRPLSWSPGKFALDLDGPVAKAILKAAGSQP